MNFPTYADVLAAAPVVRRHILQTVRLAEGAQESSALRTSALERSPFRQDDRPGKNAETEKDNENNFSDQTALAYQIHDLFADEDRRKDKRHPL